MIDIKIKNRKLQRLEKYDYSQNGSYFVTICTQNRLNLFGEILNGILILNNAGKMVFDKFAEIPVFYPNINIGKFIVMPNHLHGILTIEYTKTSQLQAGMLTISDYVHRFKTITTKLYINGIKNGDYPPFNKKVWQKSFYDHVIRNEQEYRMIWEYIDTNPLRWAEDKYYV